MRSPEREERARVRVVQATLPAWVALLLIGPAALLFAFSLAALLAGGFLAALVLPLLFRWRALRPRRDADFIELDASEFRTLDRRDLPD